MLCRLVCMKAQNRRQSSLRWHVAQDSLKGTVPNIARAATSLLAWHSTRHCACGISSRSRQISGRVSEQRRQASNERNRAGINFLLTLSRWQTARSRCQPPPPTLTSSKRPTSPPTSQYTELHTGMQQTPRHSRHDARGPARPAGLCMSSVSDPLLRRLHALQSARDHA